MIRTGARCRWRTASRAGCGPAPRKKDGAAIIYDTVLKGGATSAFALDIAADGSGARRRPCRARQEMPTTFWRMARHMRAAAPFKAVSLLEDSPFYARTLLRVRTEEGEADAFHESLSLARFPTRWCRRCCRSGCRGGGEGRPHARLSDTFSHADARGYPSASPSNRFSLSPIGTAAAAARPRSRHLLRSLRQDVAHLCIVVPGDEWLGFVSEEHEADHVLQRLGIGVLLQALLSLSRGRGAGDVSGV